MRLPAHILAIGAVITSVFPAAAQDLDYQPAEFDPAKVVGYDQCQKCHTAQAGILQQHPHFVGFRKLHRQPAAKAIAKAMGVKSVKRAEQCMRCHYTPHADGDRVKAIAGISCESCHGPAQDWIRVHNDYGGPNLSKNDESAAHRQQRLTNSVDAGMRHPSNLYLLARSCYGCHLVDDEELVNYSDHPSISQGFNMVSWSQGSMRHNYFRTGAKFNAYSDVQRLRIMYVVGAMTELEFGLRAVATATKNAEYGKSQARAVKRARKRLQGIAQLIDNENVRQAIEIADGVKLKINNAERLLAAAEQIGKQAWTFSVSADGQELGALDDLVPAKSQFKTVRREPGNGPVSRTATARPVTSN